MIEKLFTALYADGNILYFNEDSDDAVFNYNETGNANIDLNNINLVDNFEEEDPNAIILSEFWLDILNFKKEKNLKKNQIKN